MKVEKLERLASILCCPDCKSLLKKSSTTEYSCSACSKSFQVRGGVLDFISASNSEISQTSVNRIDNLLKKLYKLLKTSSTYKTKKSRERIPSLVSKISKDEFMINVGSGNTNYSPRLVNIDIEKTENVDILGDGRKLPLMNSSISLIVSQAVLEHTPHTSINIQEFERVLKPNGHLYLEVPFMQTYHAHPHDYFRFTHSGLKNILENFDIVEEGIAVGPGSALALNLRIFLSTLFSFGNRRLFVGMTLVFGWLTFPLKFFDFFMESNSLSYHSASGIYVLARKKN